MAWKPLPLWSTSQEGRKWRLTKPFVSLMLSILCFQQNWRNICVNSCSPLKGTLPAPGWWRRTSSAAAQWRVLTVVRPGKDTPPRAVYLSVNLSPFWKASQNICTGNKEDRVWCCNKSLFSSHLSREQDFQSPYSSCYRGGCWPLSQLSNSYILGPLSQLGRKSFILQDTFLLTFDFSKIAIKIWTAFVV